MLAAGLLAACGDGARPAAPPAAPPAGGSPRPSHAADGQADTAGDAPPARRPGDSADRPRVDTRARLDVTGAPAGVTVELDGQELRGVVLLPPGPVSLQVFGEELPLGERRLDLHAGETTVPDLAWTAEALRDRRERLVVLRGLVDVTEPAHVWLLAHRTERGVWDAARFADRCPAGAVCDGAVADVPVAETTGLALLAFLGSGDRHTEHKHRRVVARGLDELVRVRDADSGRLSADDCAHAIATLALSEDCDLSRSDRYRDPAQAAVDALVRARVPGRGWHRDGRPDARTTAWSCFALASARAAGFELPEELREGVLPDLGIFGDPGGTQVSAREGALLALARVLLGAPADDAHVVSGLTRALARPPSAGRVPDPEALFAATSLVGRVGGADAIRRWEEALDRDGLAPRSVEVGPFAHGSSEPGSFGADGRGRVWRVALLQLTNAVRDRSPRVFSTRSR